ncbi:MAG: exodeoxyribonuclease VII large subunit [Tissierellia bacterium]|nr:exodeoxyribonuclease VII large subunit [Tissierellia bacterium]
MKAIKVSELLKYIKKMINSDYFLSKVQVEGEISNIKYHNNGNIYFSLKDESSRVNCIMYKWNIDESENTIFQNGDKVEVRGTVNLYEKDGTLSIFVNKMEKSGIGDQYKEFLEIKESLLKEGLFDESKKKELPLFPNTIGVVTSPTGAAIRDIIHIVRRRNSNVSIIVYPALVQGARSAESVRKGIEYFNENLVDIIIIGRGGGSYEELSSFNDKELAYTIYNSDVPIVSAVGHEVDFVISDFVSDRRAPTPSAAAEISVPLLEDMIMNQDNMMNRAKNIVDNSISTNENRLEQLKLKMKYLAPMNKIDNTIEKTRKIYGRIVEITNLKLDYETRNLDILLKRTEYLNPDKMINKGYTIVKDNQNRPIKSIDDISVDSDIYIQFTDGTAEATIKSIKEKSNELNI